MFPRLVTYLHGRHKPASWQSVSLIQEDCPNLCFGSKHALQNGNELQGAGGLPKMPEPAAYERSEESDVDCAPAPKAKPVQRVWEQIGL
jgi:hypothetical protein